MSPHPAAGGKSQWVLIARTAVAAALLASGVTLAVDQLVDPFGVDSDRALEATAQLRAQANVQGCQRGNAGRYAELLEARRLGLELPGIATARADCRAGALELTGADPGPVSDCFGPPDQLPDECSTINGRNP